MSLLILHTYRQRTRNAGDWLIWHSLQQNIRVLTQEPMDHAFVRDPVSEAMTRGKRVVMAAALSIMDDVYPDFAPLNGDVHGLEPPLIPFGVTWQNPTGFPEQALRFRLNDRTRDFFLHLVDRGGPIGVRDQQAQMVLNRNGVAAVFVGDCGLYDPGFIGRPMARPTEIGSLVFTAPHQKLFRHQASAILAYLAEAFPRARKVMAHQSLPGTYDLSLEAEAQKLGFESLSVFEQPELIDAYDTFDLHVGYRLHGHIALLRKRQPSVLLVEDARGEGFRTSFPIGAFSARTAIAPPELAANIPIDQWRRFVIPNIDVVDQIATFLSQELETGFRRSASMGSLIDTAYNEAFLPTLKSKLGL